MSASDTKRELDAEAKRLVERVNKGRAALDQLSMLYPGGDICPAMVIRGLAKLRSELEVLSCSCAPWDTEQRAALQWLDAWVDAGAAMLPRENQNAL